MRMKPTKIYLNATWEHKGKESHCKWFVAWGEVRKDQRAGVLAKLDSQGLSNIERFHSQNQGSSLWTYSMEKGSSPTFSPPISKVCADALQALWGCNNQGHWEKTQTLVLEPPNKNALNDLLLKGDRIYLRQGDQDFLKVLDQNTQFSKGELSESPAELKN